MEGEWDTDIKDLKQCIMTNVVYLLNQILVKDNLSHLHQHKISIIWYFIQNQIDGNKLFLLLNTNAFISELTMHLNSNDKTLKTSLQTLKDQILNIDLKSMLMQNVNGMLNIYDYISIRFVHIYTYTETEKRNVFISEFEKQNDDNNRSDFQSALELLRKILNNIISNPYNQKYRNISYNKIFEKWNECNCSTYCINLLLRCGFERIEDGEPRLLYSQDTNMNDLKQLHDSIIVYQNKPNQDQSDVDTEKQKLDIDSLLYYLDDVSYDSNPLMMDVSDHKQSMSFGHNAISNCNVEDMIEILTVFAFKQLSSYYVIKGSDCILSKYYESIITFFKMNKIDGKVFKDCKKHNFVANLSKYIDGNRYYELTEPISKLYSIICEYHPDHIQHKEISPNRSPIKKHQQVMVHLFVILLIYQNHCFSDECVVVDNNDHTKHGDFKKCSK